MYTAVFVLSIADGALFHRLILQSGSARNPWAIAENPPSFTEQLVADLAAKSNCSAYVPPTPTRAHLMQCLRHLPVDQLLGLDLPAARYRSVVGPVVGDNDLPAAGARRLMTIEQSAASWRKLSVLLGFVSNEGTYRTVVMYFHGAE